MSVYYFTVSSKSIAQQVFQQKMNFVDGRFDLSTLSPVYKPYIFS